MQLGRGVPTKLIPPVYSVSPLIESGTRNVIILPKGLANRPQLNTLPRWHQRFITSQWLARLGRNDLVSKWRTKLARAFPCLIAESHLV